MKNHFLTNSPLIVLLKTIPACMFSCPGCDYPALVSSKNIRNIATPSAYELLTRLEKIYVLFGSTGIIFTDFEPTLQRDLATLVKHASMRSPTGIVTRAVGIDEELANDLIKSGLDFAGISLDTTNSVAFNEFTGQDSYSVADVLSGTDKLLAAASLHQHSLEVSFMVLIRKQTTNQDLEGVVEAAQQRGVSVSYQMYNAKKTDHVKSTAPHNDPYRLRNRAIFKHIHGFQGALMSPPEYNEIMRNYLETGEVPLNPFNTLEVDFDGSLRLYPDDPIAFANIHDSPDTVISNRLGRIASLLRRNGTYVANAPYKCVIYPFLIEKGLIETITSDLQRIASHPIARIAYQHL